MRLLSALLLSLALPFSPALADEPAVPADWRELIRDTPYWISRGIHDNLTTIRRWVLTGESYCADENRHILFDRRAAFLGYVTNAETLADTQRKLNEQREKLAAEQRVEQWLPGSLGGAGYPFALACKQPEADLGRSLARYTGEDASARLWGTWDGMRVGREDAPVSLHSAIETVYRDRRERGRISLPPDVLSLLAGKVLIESGGRRAARSAADARGIMQLSTQALGDCELDQRFHYHRLAQIDCALRLLEQNHRNLAPVFERVFGALPESKAEQLYSLLLIQAYHGGVGRVSRLLEGEQTSGAAAYFARHHDNFTAGDIALGLIYHNLGRDQLGFASLYYVTDVNIARRWVCDAVDDLPGCD